MIYFAGAGCGAADLITVRGMKLLEKADVVIYAGSLVNPELLSYTKEACEIYNSATMTLEEVIEVMRKAESGEQDGSAPAYRGAKSLRRSQGADGLSR